MSTWLLLAIIAAGLALFFVWASLRYRKNRTNTSGGPISDQRRHRDEGLY